VSLLLPLGSAGKSPALMSKSETQKRKRRRKMYTVIYVKNGMTFTEKRNGLCYAKMLAERHGGKVYKDGVVVWG
jgi:hypothetical protein